MELCPYLNFDGNCAEAFRFYEKVLRGKILMLQTHRESEMKKEVPPDWHNRVIHTRLAVGDKVLMGSDAPPDGYAAPQGLYVSIGVATAAEAERIFNELQAGGQVTMPFQKTFWSPGFGMLVDRYAIPWMVNADPVAAAV